MRITFQILRGLGKGRSHLTVVRSVGTVDLGVRLMNQPTSREVLFCMMTSAKVSAFLLFFG